MTPFSETRSKPLSLATNVESQVYLLFALAMGITVVGTYLGMLYAPYIFKTGIMFGLVAVELLLIFSSGWWARQSPLNVILFALFPLLSGITVTPFILSVLQGYANGGAILLNAFLATACMTAAAGVLAKFSGWDLSFLGRALLFAVLGLIAMGLLQIFVPSLRYGTMELLLSGAGVVVFGLFTAYDLQRISHMGKMGASPFILALSLYLDIFNLFLYILRFMVALSGDRR